MKIFFLIRFDVGVPVSNIEQLIDKVIDGVCGGPKSDQISHQCPFVLSRHEVQVILKH